MKYSLIIYLLVITDPYRHLDYDAITVYTYGRERKIKVIKPEPEKKRKKKRIEYQYCFLCNPPDFIPVEVWEEIED